ncbi:hypothetical protein J2S44_000859 [Catenuloplanes niger]|uniref:Uncharacterized protein n=1 Tax=Catenuloplanes niger TaxID=587534 RepID=A0AAE4CTD6_9ACTN|nr:hypothetical protein [Catenuloplanes niger]
MTGDEAPLDGVPVEARRIVAVRTGPVGRPTN